MTVETLAVTISGEVLVVQIGNVAAPGGGGSAAWGGITGTLSAQTDLANALGAKLDDLAAGTDNEIVGVNAAGTVLQRLGYTITTLLAAAYARASHTGTQLASTISDFTSAALAAVTWSTLTGKPSVFPPDAHTHPSTDISDSTTTGRSIVTAADAAAVRTAAALGDVATRNVGTTAGTAAAGDDSRITGAVQSSRTVSGGGLVTGGGDLSANRTLTVTGASTATTEAWSSTSEALTPGGMKNAAPPYVEWGVSADKTLALTDANVDQWCNNGATARVLNIPANSSVAFSLGTKIPILRLGSGTCTIDAATGVTLNGVSGGSCTISTRYQGALLAKTGTDAWVVSGDVSAVA